MTQTAQETSHLLIRPEPDTWATPLEQFQDGLPDESRTLRQELSLPTDKPLILTGHQAQFWHPGILAKYFAADAAAARFIAHAAWLIVDQDVNNPWQVRYPVRLSNGRIEERTWDASSGQHAHPDTPTSARNTITPTSPLPHNDEPFATPDIAKGLGAIARALGQHSGEPNAARQIASALADLLANFITPRPTIFATQLNTTTSFANLIAKMIQDPANCVTAYNSAAAAHPDSGIRPLIITGDRIELPLWKVADTRRMPVYATELESLPLESLQPRALLMTGILRRGACELFIHGTGGEAYDAVTEQWFTQWLDQPLPPLPGQTVVASATQLLEFDSDRPPTKAQLNEAKQRARKARHDPDIIGDTTTAQAKRTLVEQIAIAKKAGQDTSKLFAQMQQLLNNYRTNNEPAFTRLDQEIVHLEHLAAQADILNDRTWPFPLYTDSTLEQLAQEFASIF